MKTSYPFAVVFKNDYDNAFELWVRVDYDTPAYLVTDNFENLIELAYERSIGTNVSFSDYTVKEIRVGGSVVAEFSR